MLFERMDKKEDKTLEKGLLELAYLHLLLTWNSLLSLYTTCPSAPVAIQFRAGD